MNISISADKSKLDIDFVHKFLSEESYWAKKIPLEIVRRSINNSMCFGVYDGSNQIGFARVITDHSIFAYLGDVFIVPEYRGKGLAKLLMQSIKSHPDLQGLRRWMLATSDAHELYRQYGFSDLKNPGNFMEIANPTIYESKLNESD